MLQVLGLVNRIQPYSNGWYKALQLFILLENFQLSGKPVLSNRNHRMEHALIPRDFSLVTLPLAVSSGYANHSGVRPRTIIGSSPMISLVLDWQRGVVRIRKGRADPFFFHLQQRELELLRPHSEERRRDIGIPKPIGYSLFLFDPHHKAEAFSMQTAEAIAGTCLFLFPTCRSEPS